MIRREVVAGTVKYKGKTVKIRRDSEKYDIERTHGNLLTCKFGDKNDAMRMFMKVAFGKATVPMVNPEIPIIGSTYSREINKLNFYLKKKKPTYNTIAKIYRDIRKDGKDKRLMLIYEEDGIVYCKEHTRHTVFGECVSQYNEVDTEEYISKTRSFTDNGELMDGMNTMMAYINSIDVLEDSSIVSESYAERNKYLYVKPISIEVKDNVIFTSIKDDAFPEFDVVKKDKIGIAYNNDKNYSSIILPDAHYHRDTIVHLPSDGFFLGDINVWYNTDMIEQFNNPILRTMMEQDYIYNKTIYETINKIKIHHLKMDSSCEKFLDDYDYRFIKKAALRDGTMNIDKLRIDFYFYAEKTIESGQKLSGKQISPLFAKVSGVKRQYKAGKRLRAELPITYRRRNSETSIRMV